MNDQLLEQLSCITKEEEQLLSGGDLDTSLYGFGRNFIIQTGRLLSDSEHIAIRTHTRFVEFPLHSHNYVEMMFVLRGQITHFIDGKELTLHPGNLLVMNRHLLHAIRQADHGDIGINFIMSDIFIKSLWPDMEGTLFSGFFAEDSREKGVGQYLLFHVTDYLPVRNLMENLLYELTQKKCSDLILNRSVALLFQYLSMNLCPLLDATEQITREDAQKREIMQYLKANYQTAALSDLASRMHLSVPYTSALVRARFGYSFQELLIDYRLETARQLLDTTNMPVAEITGKVGYENSSFFHRKFKKKYGVTPCQYRKQWKPFVPAYRH